MNMMKMQWYYKTLGNTVFVTIFTDNQKNGMLEFTKDQWGNVMKAMSKAKITIQKDDTA